MLSMLLAAATPTSRRAAHGRPTPTSRRRRSQHDRRRPLPRTMTARRPRHKIGTAALAHPFSHCRWRGSRRPTAATSASQSRHNLRLIGLLHAASTAKRTLQKVERHVCRAAPLVALSLFSRRWRAPTRTTRTATAHSTAAAASQSLRDPESRVGRVEARSSTGSRSRSSCTSRHAAILGTRLVAFAAKSSL